MGNSQCSRQAQLRSRIQELEQQLSMVREREAMREEERRRMKKKASEDEERMRSLEECAEWRHWMGTECFVEHLKEEQKQREVAVEKWKHLYLTIKNELDDLIITTRSQAAGGRIGGGGGEEGVIQRLRAEIMGKEATIEALRSRLSRMEEAGARREREIDILKQSVRILNNGKKGGVRRRLHRRWL